MKRAIFFALLLLPATGHADAGGYYERIITKDAKSCGTYVAARDQGRRGDYKKENKHSQWLAGYITAYNNLKPDTYNIMGDKDMESVLLSLDNWCKEHPLRPFAEAVEILTIELYATRTRTAPK
jgi:hypothetical protein